MTPTTTATPDIMTPGTVMVTAPLADTVAEACAEEEVAAAALETLAGDDVDWAAEVEEIDTGAVEAATLADAVPCPKMVSLYAPIMPTRVKRAEKAVKGRPGLAGSWKLRDVNLMK